MKQSPIVRLAPRQQARALAQLARLDRSLWHVLALFLDADAGTRRVFWKAHLSLLAAAGQVRAMRHLVSTGSWWGRGA